MRTKSMETMAVFGLVMGLVGCGGSGSTSSENRIATPTINNTTTTTTTSKIATAKTAFSVAVNDSKALNITRVVRPTGEMETQIQQAIKLTNQLRAEKGLSALKYDENLSAYA